jgi:hypothetical protein
VKLASRSQKSESAAKPLTNVSATRDGDIGPGSRNAAHTVFDHRNQPSAATCRSTSLWKGEIAAHRGIVDPGAVGDSGQRHRRDTGLQG